MNDFILKTESRDVSAQLIQPGQTCLHGFQSPDKADTTGCYSFFPRLPEIVKPPGSPKISSFANPPRVSSGLKIFLPSHRPMTSPLPEEARRSLAWAGLNGGPRSNQLLPKGINVCHKVGTNPCEKFSGLPWSWLGLNGVLP